MRVWDVHPGYLNRQSLLGEHRELHGIVSILVNGKNGYANHPETMRWVGFGWALAQRHRQLTCEMALRGYVDRSPVATRSQRDHWPPVYIDTPGVQYQLLRDKYVGKESGRIPLPSNAQQLWSQHKYSVMARDPQLYQQIGRSVANMRAGADASGLAQQLAELLRQAPSAPRLRNAVQHMWGYVSEDKKPMDFERWSLRRLLQETQRRAIEQSSTYLLHSTSLSELMVWMPSR